MFILVYLEFLVTNGVSTNMVANHVSAVKPQFIMNDLNCSMLDNLKVR